MKNNQITYEKNQITCKNQRELDDWACYGCRTGRNGPVSGFLARFLGDFEGILHIKWGVLLVKVTIYL
jgi:hypothetical protein